MRLHQERWVGPGDESALERIWGSFGEALPQIAGDHIELYNASLDYGAELDDLPMVARLRHTFERDVKGTATRFLADNRSFITTQLQQLGLAPGGPTGSAEDAAQRRADALAEIRQDAHNVARAQQAQQGLRTLQVGWADDYEEKPHGGWRRIGPFPAMFSPDARPMYPPRGSEDPPLPTWEQVNARYQPLADLIVGITNANPAVYAAMRDDQIGALAGADPAEALRMVETTLRAVLGDIDETGPKIATDDLDYRDLVPIHQQLFGGTTRGPSQTDWSGSFAHAVGRKVLEDHQASEFWFALGLGSLAAAAFIVAELATFGSATFFIAAGVGIGAGALQAGSSWERYFDMAQAARTTVRDDRSVLTQGQASGALLAAIVDTAFAFLDAFQVGARGARAAATAAERAASREAAEQAERGVAAMARREAAELAQAAEQRAGASAAREASQAAGSGVLHEAPTQIGSVAHRLKVVVTGGRPNLWICSDCILLIDRLSEILERSPAVDGARNEIAEILAAAQGWQRRFESTARGIQIGEPRLVRETNDLASRLSALSARHPDIEGLVFFRTFLAGSEQAGRVLGEELAQRLTAELGEDGFVQLVRALGPESVRELAGFGGRELRQLVETRGRDLVRWLGDGGIAGGGLSVARARVLLERVPDALLTAFRTGRSRTSALVVADALDQFGVDAITRLSGTMGDRLTGSVLQQLRGWAMFTIDPLLQRLINAGRGRVVREMLPELEGRLLAEIEDQLRAAGMRGPIAQRGMRVWTHSDGSVVRIKVGARALRGPQTAPHIVREISQRPGRFGVNDIIAKVAEGGHLLPAGRNAAQDSLANWFRTVTGRAPTAAELEFLMDLWGAAGHVPIVR